MKQRTKRREMKEKKKKREGEPAAWKARVMFATALSKATVISQNISLD